MWQYAKYSQEKQKKTFFLFLGLIKIIFAFANIFYRWKIGSNIRAVFRKLFKMIRGIISLSSDCVCLISKHYLYFMQICLSTEPAVVLETEKILLKFCIANIVWPFSFTLWWRFEIIINIIMQKETGNIFYNLLVPAIMWNIFHR